MLKTSIIVVSLPNDSFYLKDCIASIRVNTTGVYEVIVVDISGSSEVLEWLADQTDIKSMFYNEKTSISQAWNLGQKLATGELILFMYADTIVTENWLELLSFPLLNKHFVGAVGPITNSKNDNQYVSVDFSGIEEMMMYAKELSREVKHEETIVLSDFLFLTTRDVLINVGDFDESLDGYAALTDYCLRMAQLGWKLFACKHVFIFSYGLNKYKLSKVDFRNFQDKWEISLKDIFAPVDLIRAINRKADERFSVLVIDSGVTSTCMKLKNLFPNARICRTNTSSKAIIDKSYFNFDTIEFTKLNEAGEFDYILVNSNSCIKLELLLRLKKQIFDSGQILIQFDNARQFYQVKDLILGGDFSYLEQELWGIEDIYKLFEQAEYAEIDIDYVKIDLKDHDHLILNKLQENFELTNDFLVESYIVSAWKITKTQNLHRLFSELLYAPSTRIVKEICEYHETDILSSIVKYDGSALLVLNYLAVTSIESNNVSLASSLLSKAYEMDKRDQTTILNLASLMYKLGEDSSTLYWLEKIDNKEMGIQKWISEIEEQISYRENIKRTIKYLLRRIENDIEHEETGQLLVNLINQENINLEKVINSIEDCTVDKTDMLNRIAVIFFNAGLDEYVLPLLTKAYTADSSNPNTLYNLSSVLFFYKEYEMAWEYINQLNDNESRTLKIQIEREIINEFK